MKTLTTVFNIVLIVFLLLVAGTFFATMLPIPGNIEVKIVKSGSMEPAIKTGGVVVIRPMETYVVGDVITFGEDTARSAPTTHRIVSIRKEGGSTFFETKGDANEEADPREVREADVIGKVIFSAPYAGFVLDFARQPLGFVLLIGVPALLVIFDEATAIWHEVKRIARRRRGDDFLEAPRESRTEEKSREPIICEIESDIHRSALQAAGIRRIVRPY